MAAHLRLSVGMETVVQTALSRGYTAQGEMFSGAKKPQIVFLYGGNKGFEAPKSKYDSKKQMQAVINHVDLLLTQFAAEINFYW